MGEILADFSVQNPIIDSLVIGLNVKEKRKQASLAQQVEREICNFDVVGSIPTGGSKIYIYEYVCCLLRYMRNLLSVSIV